MIAAPPGNPGEIKHAEAIEDLHLAVSPVYDPCWSGSMDGEAKVSESLERAHETIGEHTLHTDLWARGVAVLVSVLAAVLASLADQEHIIETQNKLIATRRWVNAELSKDKRRFIASQGNFLMIDMGADVKPFIEQFNGRAILVGRRFASMPNFMRVTIGTQAEMETFVAALREIAPVGAARAA